MSALKLQNINTKFEHSPLHKIRIPFFPLFFFFDRSLRISGCAEGRAQNKLTKAVKQLHWQKLTEHKDTKDRGEWRQVCQMAPNPTGSRWLPPPTWPPLTPSRDSTMSTASSTAVSATPGISYDHKRAHQQLLAQLVSCWKCLKQTEPLCKQSVPLCVRLCLQVRHLEVLLELSQGLSLLSCAPTVANAVDRAARHVSKILRHKCIHRRTMQVKYLV